MSFPIWIAVTTEGVPVISAKNIREAEDRGETIAAREQVYGVQLSHRCVGYVLDKWVIMTPTQARALNAKHVCDISRWQRVSTP